MNKKFADLNADVQEFIQRFENDARDVYRQRHAIVQAIGLEPGVAVADIGAGTGVFTHLFADAVGPEGSVFAVDIGPAFLKHIARKAHEDGHEGIVRTVLSTQTSAELPPGSIDVAFLCDTYHHFEHPDAMLTSIHKALRPGGRLVLIEFDLREDSSDYVKQRARAPRDVYINELRAAGFDRIETATTPVIGPDHVYMAFRRVEESRADSPDAGPAQP